MLPLQEVGGLWGRRRGGSETATLCELTEHVFEKRISNTTASGCQLEDLGVSSQSPAEWERIVVFKTLDLYQTSPDASELQYKSRELTKAI